jgi:hypothetical protein
MALGFSKLAHEVDNLVRRNLPDDIAAFFVNDLNHSDSGITVVKEFESKTLTVYDQFDGFFDVGMKDLVTRRF